MIAAVLNADPQNLLGFPPLQERQEPNMNKIGKANKPVQSLKRTSSRSEA